MDSFSVYNAGGGTTSPTPISKLGWVYFLQMRTLQSVDYSYYIRGLKGINLDANNNLTNKLFSMKLGYEETGYYDGNIGKQEWKSSLDGLTRSYAYSYDGANRILSGVFAGGKVGENYSLNSVVYDGNGNITSLSRNGFKSNSTFGLVDNLNYSYPNGSNKIQAVSDISNETASFTDVAGSTDYTYYPDGSLKSDANKGITLIEYNYLKLPKRIVKGSTTILYQYDASGKKLKETIGSNVTDYVGNLIYKNNVLYQSGHDEGRIINGEYEYNVKDHLGNLRVAFRDSLGVAKIVQANSYGVWGEDLVTLSYLRPLWKGDKFKFTGKEDLTETGYTDFRARLYDKFVPRFITIDPLAEVVSGCSPYAYVYNAPTNLIDPDGMLAEDINKPKPKPKPSTLLPEVTVTAKRLPPPAYLPFISFPNGKEYTVSDDRMAGYSLFKQYNLLDEFANGLGPANRVFLADHPMTKDMQKASGVQKARAYFYKKYMKAWLANDIANSVTKGSVTNFSASFNPIMGPLRAGSSLTEQFVGNYRVDITSIDNGENLMFKVSDAKSNNSLYYHIQDLMGDYTPSFLQDKERVDGQVTPGGNTHQIYMWTERNAFYLDPPNK